MRLFALIVLLLVIQNTQQGKWVKNCRTDGICPGMEKAGGTKCDKRDYKRLSSDYCGKCKYGWRRPDLFNDWCCTVRDRWNNDCNCLARLIPECVGQAKCKGEGASCDARHPKTQSCCAINSSGKKLRCNQWSLGISGTCVVSILQMAGANGGAPGKGRHCNPDEGEFNNARCYDGQSCIWEMEDSDISVGVCKNGTVGSGAPTDGNHLWSPNVQTVLKYKSNDLTSMLHDNQQLDELNVPSPITIEADVKVQAFRDETLRVKFEHTKFYSQNEEVSVINAHGILDTISSQNGHGRRGAHIFKTSLEQPMMIQVKNGQTKNILVGQNELDCVSKIKLMFVNDLMKNEENQQLKVVKKESIMKPFDLAPQPKKINLSTE